MAGGVLQWLIQSLSVCRRLGRSFAGVAAPSNLTQRELSELANVGLRLVSELERGKPTLRTDAVNRVLAVFGQMLGVVPAPRPPFHIDDIP